MSPVGCRGQSRGHTRGGPGLVAITGRCSSGLLTDPHTMLGQRVDVLTREGAVPGVVAGRQQKRKRGEDRKPLDHDATYAAVKWHYKRNGWDENGVPTPETLAELGLEEYAGALATARA